MAPNSERRIWRPYTQELTAAPPVRLQRAEGAYLYPESGPRLFDGISSWWLITHGHCYPPIVEALQRQAASLDQVIFANFTHEPAEQLAEILCRLTPAALTRVFFSDNGSTAVEVALKMALQACVQKGQGQRQKFLAFQGAYHGDTVGAMSVSGESPFNKPYRKTLFDVIRAEHPTKSHSSVEEFTRDFSRLLERHHTELAGVIIEPLIQAAGGMIFWPEAAVKKIAELCRGFGVYLIFDEVMTGFGRTGATFALDRLQVVPDFLCLSKGLTGGMLPLSATITTDAIYNAFLSEERSRMLFHGHSFTGNPLSCAAAVANLQSFVKGEVHHQLTAIEAAHRHGLELVAAEIPISDPRVCGTVGAFEVAAGESGYLNPVLSQLTATALQEGLLVRPLGNTVYLMPPYCTQPSELEEMWWLLRKILRQLLPADNTLF